MDVPLKSVFPLATPNSSAVWLKLDGRNAAALTIVVSDNKLLIGGGAGMYIVSAFMNHDTWFELMGDDLVTDVVSMFLGGQSVQQPVRYIVDSDRLLKLLGFFPERELPMKWIAGNVCELADLYIM